MRSRYNVPNLLSKFVVVACLLFDLQSSAQSLCKRTAVYFDVDNAQLNRRAEKRLDSLCAGLKADSYLIELYGYSDTSAGLDYNLQLAQKRIEAVQAKFTTMKTKKFLYRARNLGEGNSSSASENDRRVDVFATPLNGKYLKFETEKEGVEVPLSAFGACGVCNSRPRLSAYYNAETANAANIELKTTNGDALITAGTLKFEVDLCGKRTNIKTDSIRFSVYSENLDTDMTVWEPDTINGRVYWKPSKVKPVFDTINNRYVVSGAGPFMNLDKRAPKYGKPGYILLFPKTFDQLTSRIVTGKTKRAIPNEKDSLFLAGQQKGNTVISVGKSNDIYYLLLSSFEGLEAKSSPADTTANGCKYVRVKLNDYDSLRYQKPHMRIKFKKSAKPEDIGFYLAEYKLFIPVPLPANAKKINIKVPSADFDLAFHKKKKLYVLKSTASQLKFSKRKNMYKTKLNAKRVKKFKAEKPA